MLWIEGQTCTFKYLHLAQVGQKGEKVKKKKVHPISRTCIRKHHQQLFYLESLYCHKRCLKVWN